MNDSQRIVPRVQIAYLEISGRQTGKTTRLAEKACELAGQGRPVVFVVQNLFLLNGLKKRYPILNVVVDSEHLLEGTDPEAVWFYDEFDFLKWVQVRPGAYYATSARFLRKVGVEPDPSDVLLQLLQHNDQRHERHYLSVDLQDLLVQARQEQPPGMFRRYALGEFYS